MTTATSAILQDVIKETVLLVGDTNTGKTSWFLQVAEENPTQPVFILDTQGKVRAAGRFFGGVPKNVIHRHTPDIKSMLAFMNEVVYPALKGQPEGYGIVCIDMAAEAWTQAQELIAATRAGGDIGANIDEQRLALIAQGKDAAAGGFDGFKGHWQSIRGWYSQVVRRPMFQYGPHVLITAGARDLRKLTDDKGKVNPKADRSEYLQIWQQYGVGPDGEKDLTFWTNTALAIDRVPGLKPSYTLSVLKDMGRFRGHVFNQILRKEMDLDESGMFNIWHSYVKHTEGIDTTLFPNPLDEVPNVEV